MGSRARNSRYKFHGLIDEVAIFNRALSSNEIAAIYSAGANGMCKNALPPTILEPPKDQYVASGSNVTLTVTVSGTEPISYHWLKDGTSLSVTSEATLTLNSAQPDQSGLYSVVVSNAFGTANSPVAEIVVLPVPLESASFVDSDISISPGDTNYEGRDVVIIAASRNH